MGKLLGSAIPFFLFHLVCCGTLLVFFISSGYLFLLSQEGQRKTLLIPVLLISIILFYLSQRHEKCSRMKGYKTPIDHFLTILLYAGFSLLIGMAFMTYVFIPWWMPNYRGGPLLP